MTSATTKSLRKELVEAKRKLVGEFNYLLDEYRGFQSYFNGRTPSEAEDRFFGHMYNTSGYDAWSEGKFSLGHRSLKKRMKENKEQRNILVEKVRAIKQQLKTLN